MSSSIRAMLVVCAFTAMAPLCLASGERLINGAAVVSGTWQEVVRLKMKVGKKFAHCTATVVGPRTIITAAHCIEGNPETSFDWNGKNYKLTMLQSSLYTTQNHDIAAGYTAEDIEGIRPATVGGRARIGAEITLLGYGCTTTSVTGGNDGVLRKGTSTIRGLVNYFFESGRRGGAILCPGDSGGPGFVYVGGKTRLLGINATVTMPNKTMAMDPSQLTRTDLVASQTFLKTFARDYKVDICGINKDCEAPSEEPSCFVTAEPNVAVVGEKIVASLTAMSGIIDYATINGVAVTFPPGKVEIPATAAGEFSVEGYVRGIAGSQRCFAKYLVKNP